MRPVLDPTMTMQRDGDEAVLFRRTWSGDHPRFPLHPISAVTLALFDGEREPEEVGDILSEVFSFAPEISRRTVELVQRKYQPFLREAAELDGQRPVLYDPVDFLYPAKPREHLVRETVPQYLWWRVTRHCNRRCKYCCVGARWTAGAPPDATISTGRLKELFAEAADIGVRGVSLGGGEPFIRPDMVELVEFMLARGLEVGIDTKFALSASQIDRLARAGLPAISVSFDSPVAETANYLVGDKAFFDGVSRSMRSLVDHGIELHVTAVLTRRNVRELRDLVALLADIGVTKLTLNTFSRYYGRCRYVPQFELTDEDTRWLAEVVPQLKREHGDRIDFVYDRNFCGIRDDAEEQREPLGPLPAEKTLHCDLGIRVLRMLPDGRVSRCDQWWFEEEVVFGDLKQQSIWEVWSSEALEAMLHPPRERFAGTECADCGAFDACNATGRCIFAAHEAHGTVYAPDDHCLRGGRA